MNRITVFYGTSKKNRYLQRTSLHEDTDTEDNSIHVFYN